MNLCEFIGAHIFNKIFYVWSTANWNIEQFQIMLLNIIWNET